MDWTIFLIYWTSRKVAPSVLADLGLELWFGQVAPQAVLMQRVQYAA